MNWPTAPFSYFLRKREGQRIQRGQRRRSLESSRRMMHQEAVVTRGMRSSSGIFDSSIEILDSLPGFSLCSTEWALRERNLGQRVSLG